MTREELLARLLAERHNGGGWAKSPYLSPLPGDTELDQARRRLELRQAAGDDLRAVG